jgi:hypothetical protein
MALMSACMDAGWPCPDATSDAQYEQTADQDAHKTSFR